MQAASQKPFPVAIPPAFCLRLKPGEPRPFGGALRVQAIQEITIKLMTFFSQKEEKRFLESLNRARRAAAHMKLRRGRRTPGYDDIYRLDCNLT